MKKYIDIDIDSICSYLKKIEDIDNITPISYFRGHSKKKYEISPQLFRKNNSKDGSKNYLLETEITLYRNALTLYPELFKDCESYIKQYVMMQHYGLKTRLLDVTENPLVALYFACRSSKEEDGCVYFGTKEIDFANDIINVFFAIILGGNQNYVVEYNDIKKYLLNKNLLCPSQSKLIEMIKNDYTVIFKPVYSNIRIKAQQAAFVIPISISLDKEMNKRVKGEKYFSINTSYKFSNDTFAEKRFVIKHKSKNKIIKDLDMLGINESTMMPDAEHQMNYLNYKYFESR
jgi:hypothetical protein